MKNPIRGGPVIGSKRPSWSAARVVKASEELTWPEKAVWLEIHGLADDERCPERCYMSAQRLGKRIGLGTRHVEKTRSLLKRAGLLASARQQDTRSETWWPTMPPGCTPSSRKPTDEEVFGLAALLNDVVRVKRVKESEPPFASVPAPNANHGSPSPRQAMRTTVRSRPAGQGEPPFAPYGGVGGALPPPVVVETTSPTSSPSLKVGERLGTFAREESEQGAARIGANPEAAEFLKWGEKMQQVSREKPSQKMAENTRRSDHPTPIQDLLPSAAGNQNGATRPSSESTEPEPESEGPPSEAPASRAPSWLTPLSGSQGP